MDRTVAGKLSSAGKSKEECEFTGHDTRPYTTRLQLFRSTIDLYYNTNSNISDTIYIIRIPTSHHGRLIMPITIRHAPARVDGLDFDPRSQWLGRWKTNQGWIFSKTKQARRIKVAATVGHDKFYFSLKSSVAFVLNYGHKSISCKTHVSSLWDVIDASQKLRHDVKQYFWVPLPPTSDGHSRVDIAGRG